MSQKKKHRDDRRSLPPANRVPQALGNRPMFAIKEIGVGSWCPTPDGSGPAEAVVLHFKVANGEDEEVEFALRLKSPEATNDVIDMLIRHRNDVWPASRGSSYE